MPSFASRTGAVALAIVIASGLPLSLLLSPSLVSPAIAAEIAQLTTTTVSQSSTLTEGVTKTVLSNGLTVLTKEVRTAPVVSVQVWYRVGSRNERPGITGISHQLEHLMFKGTKDRPIQFGRLLSALGSSSNAFTSYDMTAYFGTVASDKVEALLSLEADRMVNTLAGPEQLKSENTVVLSELDGGNNNPSTRLYRAVMRAAFPNSSYGWPVIGYRTDVEKLTPEDVQNYYRTNYRPDNATLVVVGNFNTPDILQKIKDTFGKISTSPKPQALLKPANPLPPLAQPSKPGEPIILREPGSVPILQAVYPTLPPQAHPDVAAIDMMDAVLTSGKSSRLYQALVQTGIASSVGGNASTMIDPGWYAFSATPAPGKTLTEVDRILKAEVAKLQTEGITEVELERAKAQLKANYILSNREISAQASQLGYNQTVAGDYRFSDRYLEAVQKVTTADVQRVAQQYLDPQKRVLGFFEPSVVTGQTGNNAGNTHTESFSPGAPVDPSEVAKYLPKSALGEAAVPKPVQPERIKLANGMTVLLLPDKSSPSVTLVGNVQAGSGFDTDTKAGLASLTAQNLMNGTQTKDALAIASRLEDRGASLGFSASREGVSINGAALSTDLPIVLDTLSDVLQNANFPDTELELSRKRNLVSLKAELDNPGSLARRVFQAKLYPKGHPFHAMRTEETLKAITRSDVSEFYRTHYRPDTTTLALMGDFDATTVKQLLEKSFGSWQATGKAPTLVYPAVAPLKASEEEQLVLPGKTQAVTLMGHPGIARRDSRYYAALLLNHVLGGDTLASRLGTEIRDRQGLTYGIYSYFQAGLAAGPFVIQMQTSAKDNQQAINNTLDLFRQVQAKGITQAELDAAKTSIINSFPVELSDPDDIVGSVLSDELYGFPTGHFYEFPKRIQAVSLAEVNQVAQELLFPNNLLIITATPAAKK